MRRAIIFLRRVKEFFDEDQEATKAALLGSSAYTAFIVIIAILHHYLGML